MARKVFQYKGQQYDVNVPEGLNQEQEISFAKTKIQDYIPKVEEPQPSEDSWGSTIKSGLSSADTAIENFASKLPTFTVPRFNKYDFKTPLQDTTVAPGETLLNLKDLAKGGAATLGATAAGVVNKPGVFTDATALATGMLPATWAAGKLGLTTPQDYVKKWEKQPTPAQDYLSQAAQTADEAIKARTGYESVPIKSYLKQAAESIGINPAQQPDAPIANFLKTLGGQVAGTAESLTKPSSLATLAAAGGAPKLAAGLFAPGAITSAKESGTTAWDLPPGEERNKAIADTLIQGLLGGLMGKHALSGLGPTAKVPEAPPVTPPPDISGLAALKKIVDLSPKPLETKLLPQFTPMKKALTTVDPKLAGRVDKFLETTQKPLTSGSIIDPKTGLPFGQQIPSTVIDPFKRLKAEAKIEIPQVFKQKVDVLPQELLNAAAKRVGTKLLPAALEQKLLTGPLSRTLPEGMTTQVTPQGIGLPAVARSIIPSMVETKIQAALPKDVVSKVVDVNKLSALEIAKRLVRKRMNEKGAVSNEPLDPEWQQLSDAFKKKVVDFADRHKMSVDNAYLIAKSDPSVIDKQLTGTGKESLVDLGSGEWSKELSELIELERIKEQVRAKTTAKTTVPEYFSKSADYIINKYLKNQKGTIENPIDPEMLNRVTEYAKSIGKKITDSEVWDKIQANPSVLNRAEQVASNIPSQLKTTQPKYETEKQDLKMALARSAFKNMEEQVSKVTEEIQAGKGKVDPQKLYKLKKAMYLNELESAGLKTSPRGIKTSDVYNFVDNIANIANATGEDTSAALKLITAQGAKTHTLSQLKKVSDWDNVQRRAMKLMTPEEANDLIQYIKSIKTADGKTTQVFDPTPFVEKVGDKVKRSVPEFKGQVPTGAKLQALFDIRKAMDAAFNYVKQIDPSVTYSERHVPIMDYVPERLAAGEGSIYNPSVFRQRSGRKVPLDPNLWRKMNRYFKGAAMKATPEIARSLSELKMLDMRLRWRGLNDSANLIEKNVANSFGFKDPKTVRSYSAEQLWEASEIPGELDRIRQEQGMDKSTFNKVADEIKTQVHHSWIGLSGLKNIMAQSMQDIMSGGPELGVKSLGKIIKHKISFKRSAIDEAELTEVRPMLREASYNIEEVNQDPTLMSTAKKIVSEGMKGPAKAVFWLLDKVDMHGRENVYLAARDQFLNAKSMEPLLRNLLSPERQIVRDALTTGGRTEAARQYGIQMSQRIMNRFYNLDKPYTLKENWLGKGVMFTTYSRGEFSKMIRDIANIKDPVHRSAAIRRIAYPMAIGALYASISGNPKDAMYFIPALGFIRLASVMAYPYISDPIQQLYRGGPKQAIKSVVKNFAVPRLLFYPESVLPKKEKKWGE